MADTVSETFRAMLMHGLKTGVVSVRFTKRDGKERVMLCTLMESVLPPRDADAVEAQRSDTAQCVWDTEANAWRSFRWDSVSAFEGASQEFCQNGN